MKNTRTSWTESKFTEHMRITRISKGYLVANKGKKSAAGFLDQIINEHKQKHEKENSDKH